MKLLIRLFFLLCFLSTSAIAQMETSSEKKEVAPPLKQTQPEAPAKIEIKPTARDFEIKERLEAILNTTGWFENTNIQVKEGVVFLNGHAKSDEFKKWAGDLARNTQDVSAVVNKIEVMKPSIWDFHPTFVGLQEQWRNFLRLLPSIAFAFLIFVLALIIAQLIAKLSRKMLKNRLSSPLLQDVASRLIGFVVLLFGLYIIFKMLGLTTIAFTIIGGTGLLGVILGIAFRDITENLLASIFLSIHHPFQNGDLIEISGIQGYVQRLTFRSTVLLSLDGNHVQIPNATVYNSHIRNFTINKNRQESLIISVGYNESISEIQEIALQVLTDHPALLKDPEPWILVDNLDRSAINLRIYFWINGSEHNWLKVRSSVMRLIKHAFQKAGISLPNDVHELLFSDEVPVRLLEPEKGKVSPEKQKPPPEPNPIVTASEAELSSEVEDLKEQARQSRPPEKEEKNLLDKNN